MLWRKLVFICCFTNEETLREALEQVPPWWNHDSSPAQSCFRTSHHCAIMVWIIPTPRLKKLKQGNIAPSWSPSLWCQAFYFYLKFICSQIFSKWDLSVKENRKEKRPWTFPQHLSRNHLPHEVSWLQYHEDVDGMTLNLGWKWCSRSTATALRPWASKPWPLCTSSSLPVKARLGHVFNQVLPCYSGLLSSWPFFHRCGSSMHSQGGLNHDSNFWAICCPSLIWEGLAHWRSSSKGPDL